MSKRKDLSLAEKVTILDNFQELKARQPLISLRDAAEELGTSKTSLHTMLKNEPHIRLAANEDGAATAAKRKRHGKDKDIEQALLRFYNWAKTKNIPMNGPMLMEKANQIAEEAGVEFHATDGWFARWKKRNGLVFVTLQGESAEADTISADEFLKNKWPELKHQFNSRDIFNADETGVYFRALPDSTYVKKDAKKTARGCKTAKDRLTALVICSLEGEKLPLLVIGQSKSPRCFKNVRRMPNVVYEASKNAWIIGEIWQRYLRNLDLDMGRQKRKILLLVDNCSAHVKVPDLKNVTLVFLPANTTSVLQPCDMGIIRTMKGYFRSLIRQKILQLIEEIASDDSDSCSAHEVIKKVNILQAMDMLEQAWKLVKNTTVVNCWKKAGFIPSEDEIQIEIETPEDVQDAAAFLEWATIDDGTEVTMEATVEEITRDLVESVTEGKQPMQCVQLEEEDDIEEEPVTAKQLRAALSVLERGCRQYEFDCVPNFGQLRDEIRKKFPLKQSNLDHFLKM